MSLYLQQGDLMLHLVDIPKGTKVATDLVHKGQAHHHRIRGDFEISTEGNDMYVLVKSEATLYHEEHKDLKMPMGAYKKRIVVEYDHWSEESKEVVD